MSFVRHLKAVGRQQCGSVLPFFAACMTMIMGFCAISIDAGRLYTTKLALVNVADAAALAGASRLPEDPGGGIQTARDYASLNGADPSSVSVEVLGDDGRKIRVDVQRQVRLEFAGVLFSNQEPVVVRSSAIIGVTRRAKGAEPFGLEEAAFELGLSYVIKLDSGSDPGPSQGNFHALALGLRGAATYRHNVQYGYQEYLTVGDQVDTETGNMEGPTQDGINARLNSDPLATYENHSATSPRVLLIPVIYSFDVDGRKKVLIRGFASLFLEDYRVPGSGSHEIVGRFLRRIIAGDMDQDGTVTDFGTRTVKLVR